MYEVLSYEDSRGDCPADEFLDNLPIKIRAKIEKWIEKLEEEGPNLTKPFADVVRGKIRELRVAFGSNQYRFLYFFFGKWKIFFKDIKGAKLNYERPKKI